MMAPMLPPPADALAEPPPPPLRVPVRFQCPLCLDILRRPVLLPCCHRHLCTECFERALELTSVNCGFCRRRVVGFARTKRHKVDETLWRAIKTQCAFLEAEATGAQDDAPAVEFVDEDAPPLHSRGEDHPAAATSEIKAFYEQQLRAHETRRQEADQRALRQTMAFLEADAEFQASQGPSGVVPRPAPTSGEGDNGAGRRPPGRVGPGHRPLTRSKSQVDSQTQQRMDRFLAPSTVMTRSMTPDPASDADAGDPIEEDEDGQPLKLRRRGVGLEPVTSRASPLRTRSQTQLLEVEALEVETPEDEAMLITRHNHYPRSASHSPQRLAPRSNRPLFQTTLVSRPHRTGCGAAANDRGHNRGRSSAGKKMRTRQGSRRAWRCARCTFKNTCFDSRCSMCHSVPPASAYAAL